MCGIAGYISNQPTNYRHAVALAILAKHMDERGGHSWGYMTGEGDTHKALGSINLGLQVSAEMPQALALHTRYGTTGANIVANAHPFTMTGSAGTVVGVHNGIISNHAALNTAHKRSCVVDSQHIFQNIADARSLDDLQGYGAIVYTLNGVWHIGRFNNGEMSAVKTADGIFYASTKEALAEALSYAGIAAVKWLKVKNNSVYALTHKGISKRYSVDAGSTMQRWNDGLKDSYDLRWNDSKGLTLGDLVDSAPKRRDSKSKGKAMLSCELCGQYADDLYELEGDYCCAGCFAELNDCLPAGFREERADEAWYEHYNFRH